MNYKYNEDQLLQEFKEYIDKTYSGHYGKDSDGYQTIDGIIAANKGEGFIFGNIIKYASRYGEKEGRNRKDLLKILHYGLFALYLHDQKNNNEQRNKNLWIYLVDQIKKILF